MTTSLFFFFFNDTATTEIYTLSLHDALPIFSPEDALAYAARIIQDQLAVFVNFEEPRKEEAAVRSEEHTSELQSRQYLVCRLLLESKEHTSESSHANISYAVFCLKQNNTQLH